MWKNVGYNMILSKASCALEILSEIKMKEMEGSNYNTIC